MNSGITIYNRNRKVFFGGVSIMDLIKKYETPLFLFSEQRLKDNFTILQKSFKKYYSNTEIFYSIKTNYELQILKTLKDLGSKGEAASALEVIIAKKAGLDGKDLILDGPAWTDEDIKLCMQNGINTFNADSLDELRRVNAIAKKLNKKVRVSFRIFPEIRMSILKSFIEGYIAKFGVPISSAIDAYKVALRMSNVIPIAISTHIGSMVTDPSYYEKTIERLVKLAADLKSKLGIEIEEINIGGGFGVQSLNYYSIQNVILNKAGISQYSKAASMEEFGRRISQKFYKEIESKGLSKMKLVLEPGRFLVSDTGILVTKVVAVKEKWIFLSGGINLIPESIFFIRRGFLIANKVGQKADHEYSIAGPTLNTADVLAVNQKLPKMEVDDTVIVLDAGAYSLTRSNQFTILRPDVLYITIDKKVKYLRRKENPSEILDRLIL